MRTLVISSMVLTGCGSAGAGTADVPYPEGYRSWTHVKSMWIGPDHALADPFAGMHHVYVDATGERALRKGRALPDGSVLAFDLLHATLADDGSIAEGERKLLGVMRKDADKWAATGGWGFEAFAGSSRTGTVRDGGTSCFGCHASQEPQDYVFSRFRP
ncbi:MAG: cytochrome P460 family protein [Myxococcales bacterium]|nr:cytochrome P460 family protein [Myxococcales bacterium]